MDSQLVGKLLKGYREKARLTQEAVAERCGRSRQLVSLLERGGLKDPPFSLVLSYLQAVGRPLVKFASDLEREGFEKEIRPLIREEELSKETRRRAERYALGRRYFRPGVISFPEYGKERIRRELKERGEEESEKLALAFAEEYFFGLEKAREDETYLLRLKEIQERYKEQGLKLPLLLRVIQITGKVWRNERKRVWAQKPLPREKENEMTIGYAKAEMKKEAVLNKVKEFLFQEKEAIGAWFEVYLRVAREFYGELRRRELTEEEIREWEEKKVKEGGKERIIREIVKIISEEFRTYR